MKTIEQLRQEAARYAILNAGELLAFPMESLQLVTRRMATERALELAFLAGWQASRDGVQ